jgi:hypothetical protein
MVKRVMMGTTLQAMDVATNVCTKVHRHSFRLIAAMACLNQGRRVNDRSQEDEDIVFRMALIRLCVTRRRHLKHIAIQIRV